MMPVGKFSFHREDIGCEKMSDYMINRPLYFNRREYWCTCVCFKGGNPFCVIPMDVISKELVCEIGKYAECASYFQNGISTVLARALNRCEIEIESYYRCVGYQTVSVGASCAAAAALYTLGIICPTVCVHNPEGCFRIEVGCDGVVRII